MNNSSGSSVLSDEDKLDKARELKEKGNLAFKAGELHSAKGSYHRAVLYLRGLSVNSPSMMAGLASALGQTEPRSERPPMSQDLVEMSKTLAADCHNNLAACLLRDTPPKFSRVVELCTTALEAQPGNHKALFRRGLALYSLGQYDRAMADLEKAGSDSNVRKYKELCRAAIKKEDAQLADTYKMMFKS